MQFIGFYKKFFFFLDICFCVTTECVFFERTIEDNWLRGI